jgi:hypothetical protein
MNDLNRLRRAQYQTGGNPPGMAAADHARNRRAS